MSKSCAEKRSSRWSDLGGGAVVAAIALADMAAVVLLESWLEMVGVAVPLPPGRLLADWPLGVAIWPVSAAMVPPAFPLLLLLLPLLLALALPCDSCCTSSTAPVSRTAWRGREGGWGEGELSTYTRKPPKMAPPLLILCLSIHNTIPTITHTTHASLKGQPTQ